MAKAAVNKKGQEIKEYPKLVRNSNGIKVLVNSKEEEDKVVPKAAKGGWDKK